MFRKPSSHFHLPLITLILLALILSITTLAFSSRTLQFFNTEQNTNPWLLPLWRSHFDLRGLKLVVGTSAAIALCDLAAVVAAILSFLGAGQLPIFKTSTFLTTTAAASLTASLLALPATILPLVLNAHAPHKDTLQSWTCGWVSSSSGVVESHNNGGIPEDFDRVCGQSRFTTHSPLASLLLHLAILATTSLLALRGKARNVHHTAPATNGEDDGEKMVELGEYEKFSSPKA